MKAASQTLSIVIPAYNEEEAIDEILKRCLDARQAIMNETGLARVEVIVVDDGSRDRTRERAARHSEARLVVHPKNKGYGAALMTGFGAAAGEYLAFLDADGTCDPLAFVGLYKALSAAQAQMAIGNRLHPGSRMPAIRELGNRFYAVVISRLSGVPVSDTASGMRVFRRELLERLAPMPTGLHFTPAMTARAACLRAKIVETPIPYAERQGRSKLNVAADGLRFLRVILGIIFAYYPLRIFGPLGLAFGLAALAYGYGPVSYYWTRGSLREDMIYRLLTIMTLAVCALTALAFGLVSQRLSDFVTRRPAGPLGGSWLRRLALACGIVLGLGGVLLNLKTILEYAATGRISMHWSYVLTGGLAVISATVLVSFAITLALVEHLPRAEDKP